MMQVVRALIQHLLAPFGLQARRRFPFLRRLPPQPHCFAYQAPSAPAEHLGEGCFTPVRLTAPGRPTPGPTGPLYQAWRQIPGGLKWSHYFEHYEATLDWLGRRPIRLLEIGVLEGSSVWMWQQCLPPGSVVVGVDIEPTCKGFERPEENLFIRIGDQSDEAFLRSVAKELGPFDLIIDDGSHLASDMITSFKVLFPLALKSPGVYLVEDVHAAFWPRYRDQPYSFVDLCRDLVEVLHSQYFEHQTESQFNLDHPARVAEITVPQIAADIEEIRFLDSVIAIHKRTRTSMSVALRSQPGGGR